MKRAIFVGILLSLVIGVSDAQAVGRHKAERYLVRTNFGGYCGKGVLEFCGEKHATCFKGLGHGWWRCDGEYTEHGLHNRICHWAGSTNGHGVATIRRGTDHSYCYRP